MTSVAFTTYYSISGFSYDYRYYWDSGDDTPTSFDASVSMNVTADPGAGFIYEIAEVDLADGTVWVDINTIIDTYDLSLDGMDAYTTDIDSSIIGFNWTMGGVSHSTVLLELEVIKGENVTGGYEYGTRYHFVLDGDALPDFSSLSEFDNFANTDTYITDVYLVTGAYGEGQLIEWGDIESATILGADEEFTGTPGKDVFNGGYGDDYFFSSEGNDTYKGGVGAYDQVTYKDDPAGVVANLATGKATDGWGDTDKLISIEMLRGSLFDDTLIGDKGDNHIRGLAGDDILNGGKGTDTVRYDRDANYGGTDGVTVNLKKGYAIDGFGDRDTLKKFENVRGTETKDTITGTKAANDIRGEGGADVLKGLGGKDVLEGGGGNDKLYGGNGKDVLYGDNGKDKLDGGKGDDDLYGGAKTDIFIFSGKFGNDTIHDFQTKGTGEKIDLSDVSTIKNFKDLSNNHLSEVAGNAVIDDGNGNTITLDGVAVSDLAANDFLF